MAAEARQDDGRVGAVAGDPAERGEPAPPRGPPEDERQAVGDGRERDVGQDDPEAAAA